jgi:dCMP deaminase
METEIKEEYLGEYRKDTLKHDLVAMEIACISSKESKDPSTQVGACILSSDERVVSTGFNHNPTNWDSNRFPWKNDVKTIGEENTKYPYIIHAEMDAISKCSNLSELKEGTIYVTLFPCTSCAKTIISFGIKRVVYAEFRDTRDLRCAKRLLEKCGVEIVRFNELIKDDKKEDSNSKKKIKLNLKKRGE